jgi:quercetin dioxygenase-like cupin family protein
MRKRGDIGARFVPVNRQYKVASNVIAIPSKRAKCTSDEVAGRRANGGSIMKTKILMLVLVCLVAVSLSAQEAKVTSLMSKNLPDLQGKEGLMLVVEYPPGASDPIHRHDADAFVYVLEGSVVMQVRGGKEVTLTPGQTFYEGPDDIHTVGRNASKTEPAKFVVFLVKKEGAPVLTPVK